MAPVQATVVPVQQSRQALDAGLVALADGRAQARSPLATIRVETAAPQEPGPSRPAPRRRSALLRIDFLRN